MATGKRFPSHDIRDQYVAIKDIPMYYEGISEELINELVSSRKVGYAELKEINGTRRTPHVNMVDVLTYLGKEVVLTHPNTRGEIK